MINKKKRFNQIVKDIKKVKIQGATNVARSALQAYFLIPTKSSKKKLISLRPTEPLLVNVLNKKQSYKEILKHFSYALEKINKYILKLIKNDDVIFTHCHSTSVVNSLIYSKKKKRKFEVYNTETRPLYQGRKTARELKKAGIKITMFVDSAAMIAITKSQGTKKVDKVFLGADALLKKGIINKVGSAMFAKIAYENKIPVYIISDSWKFSSKNLKIEERDFHEIWKKLPKNSKIKIRNPAFEFVPKKYITKIVSELGVLTYDDFLKKVKN
tara:strand:- start:5689 stop:6501 length:813 start_codon:yes stop_codon:yes gene_type:complete